MRGSYSIIAFLDHATEMRIGALGRFFFPEGFYVYTGSALSSLEGRLKRHLMREKKVRWHIDYFLEKAVLVGFASVISGKRMECEINSSFLKEGEIIAKGFGSTDCMCDSHLIYLGD